MWVHCFARRDLRRKEKQKRDEQERKKIEELLGCTGVGFVGLHWQLVEESVYRLFLGFGYVNSCILVTSFYLQFGDLLERQRKSD